MNGPFSPDRDPDRRGGRGGGRGWGGAPAPGGVRQPLFNIPPVTKALALALLAIHGVLFVVGDEIRHQVVEAMAFVPVLFTRQFGGAGFDLAANARLLGHMLLHGDGTHLALNVGFLVVFGTVCERAMGGWRALLLLIVSGVAGALTFTAIAPQAGVALIGASGAVYGAAGGMVRLVFLRRGSLRAAVTFGAVLLGVNVVIGVFGGAIFGGGQEIAWQAHIGGFIAGLALVFAIPTRRRRHRVAPERMQNE